jgi:translation initiation factor IF-3
MRDKNQIQQVERAVHTRSVLLIDGEGRNLGIIDTREAYRMADSVGLDLVQVGDGKNDIPVCKIMDYGKWKYEQAKKHKVIKTTQSSTKELKIRPNTNEHDLEYRAKQAIDFLEDGNRVKVMVRFKGRERNHMTETGRNALEKFLSFLDQSKYKVEKAVDIGEKEISITLMPAKQ